MTRSETFVKLIDVYHQNKKMFCMFLMTGLGTAILYFSIFSLTWSLLHINHIFAVSLSYSISATFHFYTNRHLTFKTKDPGMISQLFKYIFLIFLNYIITLGIVQFSLLFINSSPYVGVILSTGATAITGYLLSKYWIFKATTITI